MRKILFVANIAKPEVEMINLLYEALKAKGVSLYLLLFRTHNANILKLKPPKFVLNHTLLDRLILPDLQDAKIQNNYHFEKYYSIDSELYQKINRQRYKSNFKKYIKLLGSILDYYEIDFVILNNQCDGVYELTEDILTDLGMSHIKYLRWSFTGYYKFNNALFDEKISLNIESNYSKDIVDELPLFNFKYPKNEAAYKQNVPYVLFLGGGHELGTGIKSSKYYNERGYKWGSDIDIINHLIDLWEQNNFDKKFDLVVRQHPFTRFKYNLEKLDKIPFIKNGRPYELANLINGAKGMICTHTTLVEHIMLSGKKLCVLGNHEFCNYCLPCLKNSSELISWLSNLDVDEIDQETINQTINCYYHQYVLNINDEGSVTRIVNRILEKMHANQFRTDLKHYHNYSGRLKKIYLINYLNMIINLIRLNLVRIKKSILSSAKK